MGIGVSQRTFSSLLTADQRLAKQRFFISLRLEHLSEWYLSEIM